MTSVPEHGSSPQWARRETPLQRFHLEVYVAPETDKERISAAVAAGRTVVDDSGGLTVIADQDGNKGILCVDTSAVKQD